MTGNNMSLKKERRVNIVLVIDGTGSMAPCIGKVKSNATKFGEYIVDKLTNEYASSIEELAVKVITFRDYKSDGDRAMQFSQWYDLSAGDDKLYEEYLKNITVEGGGDEPENGLEALFYAMTTDWKANGDSDRQIIVLFTDADAHPIGKVKGDNGPENMVDEKGLINTWMCIKPDFISQSEFRLNSRCKRLVMFAPAGTCYDEMKSVFDHCQFVPTAMSEGLGDISFDAIIKEIAASVTAL